MLPESLTLNGWTGAPLRAEVDPDLGRRILGLTMPAKDRHMPAAIVPLTEWQHPEVGWGLVLPDDPDVPAAERWRADDAPDPIRRLVAARGNAPVFRVGPDWQPGYLHYYDRQGRKWSINLGAGRFGTAAGHIPRYLLILGGPDLVPWDVQYDLHATCFVGRLDLDAASLERYVAALLHNWPDRPANRANTQVWSVDHGGGDITELMRDAVGKPLHQLFADDIVPALAAGARYLGGRDATAAALEQAVAEHRPQLIATTSHGATLPLDDPRAMRAQLGLPVDDTFALLDADRLVQSDSCSGAVWLAQACCSAGSSAKSAFEGILRPGSDGQRVLDAVAACGNMVAPLPRALLGAQKPLAAFVGHVEPTFDWTMRDPSSRQYLTTGLLQAFHRRLYTGLPVGWALDSVRAQGGSILSAYTLARRLLVDQGDRSQISRLMSLHLAATDLTSMVLLGDPTVQVYP
ncbi:hypothetical protein EYC08_16680 [Tabrizicola sp. WMC-M-20]|nr:hypothetical protein EYC08_16680 [Tabrizicola sp. WMC-M-20]